MSLVLLVSFLCVLVAADPLAEIPERNPKFLSLFQTIKFENAACNGTGTEKGACFTAAECTTNKGTVVGKCANDFGVCCKVTAGCDGGNNKLNLTYFESSFTEKKQCKYQITAPDNIAMIRLDFEEFNLAQPEKLTGVCTKDKFMTNGLVICGDAKGQHYYLPYTKDKVQLIVNGAEVNSARKFKIKVSLIEKDNPCLPPTGCQQYYYEKTMGQITSFNYKTAALTATATDTRQLSSQTMRICFRKGEDMCSISYKQCVLDDNSFTLTGNAQVADKTGLVGNANAGPPVTTTTTGRKRRSIDFTSMFAPGHFRQGRAAMDVGDVCGADCSAMPPVCCTDGNAVCLMATGAPCTAATGCDTGTQCACKPTYTAVGTTCESTPDVTACTTGGTECTAATQECPATTTGFKPQTCQCKATAPLKDGKCTPAATLDQACTTGTDCATTSETCTSSKCVCATDYTVNTGTACLKPIGATCAANTECAGANQECTSLKCACKTGFVELAGTPATCVAIETTTTACTAADTLTTCGAATVATCVSSLCVCAAAYEKSADGKKCVPRLGQPCTPACGGANQACTASKCACNAYSTETSGKCVVDISLYPYAVGDCGLTQKDYIKIPCPTAGTTKPTICYGDKFCGTALNMYTFTQSPENVTPQSLKSFTTPFTLDYKTDETELAGELGNAGYCLNYDQAMCT